MKIKWVMGLCLLLGLPGVKAQCVLQIPGSVVVAENDSFGKVSYNVSAGAEVRAVQLWMGPQHGDPLYYQVGYEKGVGTPLTWEYTLRPGKSYSHFARCLTFDGRVVESNVTTLEVQKAGTEPSPVPGQDPETRPVPGLNSVGGYS